jgi:two-component system nitrogen regulation sensor histidine kinase GlnL
MLAHEIKNPLWGIRGAAQLLEQSVTADELPLARLVREEVDRIVDLIDRVEVFGDDRPIEREAINIHVVLDRVKLLAKSGVARNITFSEDYDPSLPPVFGNRDQLIQVFLNLVKNAAEALERTPKGEIRISTAFRPGIRIAVQGVSQRISLPLEIVIEDNGPGIPSDLLPILFDPFVTTKANGSGLGLALVAKIVGDHGGVIDHDSRPGRTRFRVLLPVAKGLKMPDETIEAAAQ